MAMCDKNDVSQMSSLASRRSLLKAGAVALAAPALWIPKVRAANRVLVRTPGGAYDDIRRKLIYEPFQKVTGIEVVPVAATLAKMMAMVQSGHVEVDVIDTGDDPLIQLGQAGGLEPIPYGSFSFSKPEEIDPAYRHRDYVGNFLYATVMSYNTETFPKGKQPKNWAEFWDPAHYPGPRMLADMATGSPNLEFALLADGVPREKLYPLDIDRAFRVMSKIRSSIVKFWDSGALSSQMLSDKQVVLGSLWHTRAQSVIDQGAPVAINWNQHMAQVQAYAIPKNAPNKAAAGKFIDFCLQPQIQAEFSKQYKSGPVSEKAYALLPADFRSQLPGGETTREKGFLLDAQWWAANRSKVSEQWSNWVLG